MKIKTLAFLLATSAFIPTMVGAVGGVGDLRSDAYNGLIPEPTKSNPAKLKEWQEKKLVQFN